MKPMNLSHSSWITLAEIIRFEKTLPFQIALKIAHQLTLRLSELRSDGDETSDLHPVVSPESVVIGLGGEVWFQDFQSYSRVDLSKSNHSEISTVGYLAPESLRGKPQPQRSELFGVGVIIFEMLSGRRLYQGDSLEVRSRILEEPPPDLGEERVDTPPQIVELLFELLCKDPLSRPPSLSEVSQRISDLLEERVSWEGESDVGKWVSQYNPEDLTTPEKVEIPPLSQTQSPDQHKESNEKHSNHVRRDAIVVALLLSLSALVGSLLRIVSS